MTLLEYIKTSYLRPNKRILDRLGASDKLIAYLFETPKNTNINMIRTLLTTEEQKEESIVIFNDYPDFMNNYEHNYTYFGGVIRTEPESLADIKVGTVFKVELNDSVYSFTIANIYTEDGNRRYDSEGYSQPDCFTIRDVGGELVWEMDLQGIIRAIGKAKVTQIIDEEQEEDGTVIFNDTITLVETSTAGIYEALINTSFVYEDFTNVPETIIVEIGGQTLELPHFLTNFGVAYGEMEDDWGSFDTYPIWVWINEDGSGEIATNTFGGEQKVIIKFPSEAGQ